MAFPTGLNVHQAYWSDSVADRIIVGKGKDNRNYYHHIRCDQGTMKGENFHCKPPDNHYYSKICLLKIEISTKLFYRRFCFFLRPGQDCQAAQVHDKSGQEETEKNYRVPVALTPIDNLNGGNGGEVMQNKKKTYISFLYSLILAFLLTLGASPGKGAEITKTKCTMVFGLTGWSIFYETASGTGIVTCNNGQTADVTISMKGGGLTAGRYRLRGNGEFTEVYDIADLFGVYGAADAHAGALRSARAQVLTKGDVSLALVAKGQGIDLGVGFNAFKIEPIYKKKEQVRPQNSHPDHPDNR